MRRLANTERIIYGVTGKEIHLRNAVSSMDTSEMLRSSAATHCKVARNLRAYSDQKRMTEEKILYLHQEASCLRKLVSQLKFDTHSPKMRICFHIENYKKNISKQILCFVEVHHCIIL
jgi:hypothetical protein